MTTTLYDADGEVTAVIDPLGHATTTLYDADGEVTEVIDPLGHATTTLYDADGEVTEVIDPMGRITTTLYDADGEVTATIDPLGRTTTTFYDADGEVTEVVDPMGRVTTTLYDADGEVIETIDPLGHATTTMYDADGEVTEVIDALGYATTTMYDADGEVTEVIDPLGNVTTTIYDADGEVTETIDPLGHMTTTLYDADGEVTETIDPLGRMTTSLYDGDGRLVSQTWYNAQGVVVNTESFTYDADGNMLTAQNDSGTYTMTYDALNRLITTQDPFGLTLTYTYDADGNRTQVQDSLGGVTNYIYDADNELTSEQFGGTGQTPLRIDLTYDADGEILTETRYSNLAGTQVVVVSSYTYNNDGQITSLVDVNGSGNTVADFTYTYDQAGRLTSDDSLGVTTTYTYDADNELLSESSSLATIDYSYDANGNRTGGGNVVGPDNQLLSDGTWNYTYDADGNLVQEVGIATGPDAGLTWTYTYNNRNQMTSAVETQGSTTLETVTYTYDVFGNRIEEDTTSGSSTQVTRFAYDGQNIWADLDGNNNLVTRRLFLNTVNSVTARITASGTVAWYLTDRLGSVRVLTDNTGSVIDEINYDAYGNILTQTNPAASDRYLWTGEQFDAVTGLQYNRARYYDPTTGRWTTEDPLGFAAGDTNLYRYAKNDPTNGLDATGLAATLAIKSGKLTPEKYGKFNWPITWEVPAPNIKGKGKTDIVGVIIQRIVTMFWAVDAKGTYVPLFGNKSGKRGKAPFDYSGISYLEAWKVQNDGKVVPLGNFLGSTANDWYWAAGTLPVKTCGWIEIVGYATYYPGLEPWQLKGDLGFTENWAKGAGMLLSYGVPAGRVPETDLWEQIKYVDKRLTFLEQYVDKRKIVPSEPVEHSINLRWDMNKDDGQVVVTSQEPK